MCSSNIEPDRKIINLKLRDKLEAFRHFWTSEAPKIFQNGPNRLLVMHNFDENDKELRWTSKCPNGGLIETLAELRRKSCWSRANHLKSIRVDPVHVFEFDKQKRTSQIHQTKASSSCTASRVEPQFTTSFSAFLPFKLFSVSNRGAFDWFLSKASFSSRAARSPNDNDY